MNDADSPKQLVDHFFRHEYGRMVALLTKTFGLRHLDQIEDMVQSAQVQALQSWRTRGIPDDPAAWIYRVAKNKMLDDLRHQETTHRLASKVLQTRERSSIDHADFDDDTFETEIEDSLLRMIFACSHPDLPIESQLALTLKTLCGFSRAEIAHALLTNEETVKKRISRAKKRLVEQNVQLEVPGSAKLPARLETVHAVLYLMFNEGYSATSSDQPIRHDLCEEAGRLCFMLCNHPHCATADTFALMALMLFHAARFDARLDCDGLILLLEEQDRTKWDYRLIAKGLEFLQKSTVTETISTYHLEAGIAMYHCKAAKFSETDWQAILRHYDLLIQTKRSPIYLLNRAIALGYAEGHDAGIRALDEIRADSQLRNYHLLDAALGELHFRAGDVPQAKDHFEMALQKSPSPSDRELLRRRIARCNSVSNGTK